MAAGEYATRAGLISLLEWIAARGRFVLVSSLFVGVALPGLAAWLEPYVGPMVGVLLFLNAFRSGDRLLEVLMSAPGRSLGVVFIQQLALPLALMAAVWGYYGAVPVFWFAGIMMLSSPSLSGNPNFLAMLGRDPIDAMRLLVTGTLAFPAIAFLVLWLMPGVDGSVAVAATVRLAGVILVVVFAGVAARRLFDWRLGKPEITKATDGASAALLGVVVVGLMAEVGPLLREAPGTLALWMLGVMAFNLVVQLGGLAAFRRAGLREAETAAVVAGNRNTVLYLIAVPPEIAASMMLFIGCYQVPMYLTPLIMGWVLGRSNGKR